MFRLVFGSVSCVFDTCDALMIAILCIFMLCVSSFMLICLYLMAAAQCAVQDFI
jgi:predicted Co/Zn/Cd cation transporter (cation efflux family)